MISVNNDGRFLYQKRLLSGYTRVDEQKRHTDCPQPPGTERVGLSVVLCEVSGLCCRLIADRTGHIAVGGRLVADGLLVVKRTHDDLAGDSLLDRLLAVLIATPRCRYVAAVAAERSEDLLPLVGLADAVFERFLGGRLELVVHLVQLFCDRPGDPLAVGGRCPAVSALAERDLAVLDPEGPDLDPAVIAFEFQCA